ncbi:ubiquitin carboxyl-terminal hydrolase [Holotrichia oblita]|uniref:Ubiquitin carboxyl-terminal hydrolase n=1 Tax=Holotrichia oblita TaxID=644536 RepID=A0ACB9SNZ2_HOLOL|nr:ubiquitin carboxyl-terminal hydrolase [Holotrichia oblita]
MCDDGRAFTALVMKTSSSENDARISNEMTVNGAELSVAVFNGNNSNTNHSDGTINSVTGTTTNNEPSRLKRTFTLPRIPFNAARMSKRKSKKDGNNVVVLTNHNNNNNNNMNKNNSNSDVNLNNDVERSKKVFRRPSFRKFINKIAQHIGGVPVMGQNNENNRVPPVDLQTWAPDQTPGVTGIRNHGNTCFINAVLQCISHTDVLAEYFVLDKYKVDMSRRNKLNSKKFGTKGEVTEQLALLLKALWACQYTPDFSTSFKQIVERHGPQYKGTQQHDALEFLQWLLDKVHEDLNMASKRKYKSIKTSGRPDEVIAAETLENYKRCNNSFIQGVFQAQYRSSLSCSRCSTQSNTFDPFQCISVQLPQLNRHSIYVTVLYTSQQPRQVKIGLSIPTAATVSELRDILESDTSISRTDMLLTEIGESGFLRTFTDTQSVSVITEIDPIYCIEVAQLKDVGEESTSAYVLLCWINVVEKDGEFIRFGSPYTMQVSRETSYEDLQKLILKEMAPILHDDILTNSQTSGIFKMRISDPACNDNEPPCYLEPHLEHPLFMEAVDQALALCSEEGGPAHMKLVLEWTQKSKSAIIADEIDIVEEHSTVKVLRAQALQGGAPLTLEECLRHYTKAETLTMDDAWRCPQCQQYIPVIKTLDVWSLPDILVVHFKRFRQQTLRGRNSTKLTTMVDFPVYGFDMTPHLANKHNTNLNHNIDSQNPVIINNMTSWSPWKRARKQSTSNDNTYDLYAVIYHHGTDLETGHYTAACKNPYDNNWYLYDDAKVTNLTQQSTDISTELVNNSAYILFYQKRYGVYVSSSSNSSSAASTSSVGSSGDHWVSRMPKFVPPKHIKAVEKSPVLNKDAQIKQEEVVPSTEIAKPTDITNNDQVNLRNSQNTLYNSHSNIKKLESKSTNTINSINIESDPPKDIVSVAEVKKPIYTTSIYINSSGNANIISTKNCENDKVSPVISTHRINGINEDNVRVNKYANGYESMATIYRYSHVDEPPEHSYHSDGSVHTRSTSWVSSILGIAVILTSGTVLSRITSRWDKHVPGRF